MSTDAILRIVAALAAVALVAAPAVAKVAAQVAAWRPSTPADPEKPGVSQKDMHLVLDLAARLKAVGCADGVSLCQQLLDVMLKVRA